MKIQSHDIQLASSRESIRHHEINERLTAWQGDNRVDISSGEQESSVRIETGTSRSVLLDISKEGMAKFLDSAGKKNPVKYPVSIPVADEEEQPLPSKLQYMKLLLEKFFGVKIEIVNPVDEDTPNEARHTRSKPPANEPPRQGWGIDYSYHEMTYEKELVRFSAGGTITTEDGREINFDAKLEMSKETLEQVDIEFKAGDALIDPLAVNLDGLGVQLTEKKFDFDLDSDGKKENISFVEQGSGFLVLDKNQNGIIDDGSEMFGPTTNNGFLELKAYDADRNDWIDENDAIFFDLNIWTKNEEGADRLSNLKAYDIGAIYLNGSRTTFDLGEGRLRETGVYLEETGSVGFIQEVDLAT
jgi:hypothetical protein